MYDLRYATHKDYNFLYELNKITMLKYIEKIWGWEENIQQKFFRDKFSHEERSPIRPKPMAAGGLGLGKEAWRAALN